MADENSDETLSIQIANQIINVANRRLEDGLSPTDVAAGLRHAAANFSAFVLAHDQSSGSDPMPVVEEFVGLLEFYLERHQPSKPDASGLHQLVQRVKDEL